MNLVPWITLVLAAGSAGVFCGTIAAHARGAASGRIPLPGLLVATALFGFSRLFGGVAADALTAIFCGIAGAQIVRAPESAPRQKALALVPVAAMLFIAAAPLLGAAGGAVAGLLVAALCAPLVIAVLFALWERYLPSPQPKMRSTSVVSVK